MFNPTEAISRPGQAIRIYGAREHNLKNVSLSIPRGQFVVITGVSGSGKSTVAFDLIFAEGQRRFLDSMNTYARQFVEQLARPEVDLITGIPPTVSIEQRNSRGGGKSTVATVTEIYHFLRLLFARAGIPYCPACQLPVRAQTREQLLRQVQADLAERGDLLVLAPVVKGRKGFHTDIAVWAAKHGYAQIRADGKLCSTSERVRLDRFREHNVEIVIGLADKKRPRHKHARPLEELVAGALQIGSGVLLTLANDGRARVFSTHRACPGCNESFELLDPKMFSYNSPVGWCPACRGFGELFYLPDVDRGARADAIEESWFEWQDGKREPCPECRGSRLSPVSRAVRLDLPTAPGTEPRARLKLPTIDQIASLSVDLAAAWVNALRPAGRDAEIARDILPEIRDRLKFLREVGLGYLQLSRGVVTLSGGEAQRIRLAAQLGSNLTGALYVLDEPTIGLHARDNEQLLAALAALKARGNSLIVVEHDEETMRRADFIIDLGPGAGIHGGEVVATGTCDELMANPHSVTGQALRQIRSFPLRGERRPVILSGRGQRSACLELRRAHRNNLRNLTVQFPLHRFVAITGVSGSGKSTLIRECLIPSLKLAIAKEKCGPHDPVITGAEAIKAVYEVDQSPIGRTPRSTPATYVGFFDEIRRLFAQTPEARLRGFSPSRFSFNSALGRCPQCEGAGTLKLEMSFLPPAYVRCEACQGTRFNPETLDIQYGGKSVAQVLQLSVAEALDFFSAIPKIRAPLEALRDTGLDYVKLGQISPTLSGGEAQRLKLVTHLLSGLKSRLPLPGRAPQQNVFILEEPTIGLHIADIRRLLEVIQRLIDADHSVIVIEHNLDLIAEADWVIDLGPEGGGGGGRLVASGTPEEIALAPASHTGRFLRKLLRIE